MNELVIILYMVYMAINLYTDSKRLETYNRLHLIVGLVLTVIYFMQDNSITRYIIIVCFTLVLGIIAENLKLTKISPGDTKMLMVSGVFLGITTSIKGWVLPIILIVGLKMITSLFVVTFGFVLLMYHFSMNRQNQKEYSFKVGNYLVEIRPRKKRLPTLRMSIPATGGVMLITIILYSIFHSI